MKTVRWFDAAVIAIATGVTVGAVMYVNTSDAEVIIKEIPVTLTPQSCAGALDAAAHVVDATTILMDTANRLGPLTADAYAAGLAGADPTRLTNRVARLNVALDDAYVEAAMTPKRFAILAAQCRAGRTQP